MTFKSIKVSFLLFFLALCFTVSAQTKEEKIQFCQDAIDQKELSVSDLEKLRNLLKDSMFDVRKNAARALAAKGDNSINTLQQLTKYLELPSVFDQVVGKDESTRAMAAFTLLRLGEKGKLILKDKALNSSVLRVKVAALLALYSSTNPSDTVGLFKVRNQIYREIEALNNPSPELVKEGVLSDPTFATNNFLNDWNFVQKNTKGSLSFAKQSRNSGSGSLLMEKLTSEGEIYLKSKKKIFVKKDEEYLVRVYFRADDASSNTTLQIVFEDADGNLSLGNDVYAGQSQTFVRNAAPRKWYKRLAYVKPKEDSEFNVGLVLRGHPAKIYIDDVTIPAKNVDMTFFPMEVEINDLKKSQLAEKSYTETKTAVLKKNDRLRLSLNGVDQVPIFYHILNITEGNYPDYTLLEGDGGVETQVVSLDFSNRGNTGLGAKPVWGLANKFDFSTTFEKIENALSVTSKTNIILNINVAWTKDWFERNPDQAWLNIKGQKAYGRPIHVKGFADRLESDDQIWWPSPFSEKAIQDAQAGIKLFIDQLKKKPYFHKVIGCHISGGHDGQFYTGGYPDYSLMALKSFKEWLKKVYLTDDALQKSWNDRNVTFENATIPDYADRVDATSALFYNPVTERRFVDHTQFQAEQGMVLRDRFAETFKKEMAKPVFALTWALGGGRGQGTQNIFFASKYLDALVAQPTYARRLPGYVGGMRNVAITSFKEHGKFIFKELDLRTWIRNYRNEAYAQRLSSTENDKDFRQVMRKEYMQMLAQGMGYWLFDIDQSNFKDPGMLSALKEGVNLYKKYELNNNTSYRSEVAMLWVDESLLWEKMAVNVNNGITLDGFTNFNLAEGGFTMDHLYLNDVLRNPDLQKYKFYIFKDSWKLTALQRQQIAEKLQKDGKVLIWNYAAGYIGDDKLSDEYLSELVKIKVSSEKIKSWPQIIINNNHQIVANLQGSLGTLASVGVSLGKGSNQPKNFANIPRFIINDKEVQILATYQDQQAAVAVKEMPSWTSVYFGMLGSLDARLVYNILKKYGGHTFVAPGVGNVEFNGKLLAIHFLKNEKATINIPFNAKLIDFDTNRVVAERSKSFSVDAVAGETKFYIVNQLK